MEKSFHEKLEETISMPKKAEENNSDEKEIMISCFQ